ncbi:MAG: hypothetical protein ABL855_00745, partial [Sideroxydans sp.]
QVNSHAIGWSLRRFDSVIFFTIGVSMKRTIGTLLMAAWLVVTGLSHLLHLSFTGMSTIMSGVAIAAGVMIILGL